MPISATEFFDWAVGRAIEYVDLGDTGNAMCSLVSDFGKHEATAGILTPDLMSLFVGEVLIGGAAGARRFIEGIPRPADQALPTSRPKSGHMVHAIEDGSAMTSCCGKTPFELPAATHRLTQSPEQVTCPGRATTAPNLGEVR